MKKVLLFAVLAFLYACEPNEPYTVEKLHGSVFRYGTPGEYMDLYLMFKYNSIKDSAAIDPASCLQPEPTIWSYVVSNDTLFMKAIYPDWIPDTYAIIDHDTIFYRNLKYIKL